jgi:hypothetical protein
MALVLAAVLMYCPVFAFRVPFPADAALNFPVWDAQTRACCNALKHAEKGDLVTQIYPWRSALGRSLRNGVVPLWNPQLLMGTPFLAEPVYAVFFPLNWVYAIFSPPFALAAVAIARMAILAVTMALFVKRLGASNAGALISGFTLSLCGFVTAWGGWPQVDSIMWLPLICLSIDSLRRGVSPRGIALASISMALPVLAGHPEVALQVILTALSYAVYRFFPIDARSLRYLASFAGAALISVLLAAVQLFPTLEWLTHISRSLAMRWGGFPLRHVLAFVSRDLFRNLNVDHLPIPEGAAYVGALTLAALPFVWLWPKKRDVVYFACLVVSSLGIVYSIQPFSWISEHIPVLAGLPNTRFLGEADFGLAVLGGLAVSALQSRCEAIQSGRLASVLGVAVFVIAGVLIGLRGGGILSVPFRFNLLVIAAALAVILLAFTRRISSTRFVLCSAILLTSDLGTFAFGSTPFVSPTDIFPPNATFNYLRDQADSNWRVASVDVTYANNFEMQYSLCSPGGYDFPLKRTAELLSVFSHNPTIISFNSKKLVSGPPGLLDLTSTRFFVATDWNGSQLPLAARPDRFHEVFRLDHIWIFEYPSALPLAFLAPKSHSTIVSEDATQRNLVLMHGFDPRRVVILSSAITRFGGKVSPPQANSVRLTLTDTNEFDMEAATDQDSLLVLNEAFYPGWRAFVDGEPVEVLRTNYAFMSIPITTGSHRIKLQFEPPSFKLGAVLSVVGLTICFGLLVSSSGVQPGNPES